MNSDSFSFILDTSTIEKLLKDISKYNHNSLNSVKKLQVEIQNISKQENLNFILNIILDSYASHFIKHKIKEKALEESLGELLQSITILYRGGPRTVFDWFLSILNSKYKPECKSRLLKWFIQVLKPDHISGPLFYQGFITSFVTEFCGFISCKVSIGHTLEFLSLFDCLLKGYPTLLNDEQDMILLLHSFKQHALNCSVESLKSMTSFFENHPNVFHHVCILSILNEFTMELQQDLGCLVLKGMSVYNLQNVQNESRKRESKTSNKSKTLFEFICILLNLQSWPSNLVLFYDLEKIFIFGILEYSDMIWLEIGRLLIDIIDIHWIRIIYII